MSGDIGIEPQARLAEAEARIRVLEAALRGEAARRAEERDRMAQALDASGVVGIWDGDIPNRMVYADENFARIYGTDPGDAVRGMPSRYYFQFIHPEDAPAAVAKFEAVLAGEAEYHNEHRIVRPDGEIRWVLARGRMERDEAGAAKRFSGVSVDITDRKEGEARQVFLLALQDRLRGLTEPAAILREAAAALGRHLGANRIGYGRVAADGRTVEVSCAYADGAPAVEGVFDVGAFGAAQLARLRRGETVVMDDVLADPGRNPAVWDRIGARAHVSVPLLRDGVYRGTLFVSYVRPRAWRREIVALIEAVAGRLWEAAERGRAEAVLRDSEERARIALEAGGFGAWEYDAASGATKRSARHDEIFGIDPAEGWGLERFLERVAVEDREEVRDAMAAAMTQGGQWRGEFRIARADGAQRWVEVRAKFVPGAAAAGGRMLGVVGDVTERRLAEDRLRASEAQFRSFAQAMPHHVWTTPPDGMLDWVNDRIVEYSGLPREAVLGTGWAQMVHPEDLPGVLAQMVQARETVSAYEAEFRIRRADGMYRWFIGRALPIRGADGGVIRWLGTATDIDDQKMNAAALAALNASLEAQIQERTAELMATEAALRQSLKMEAVGQLTGGIAHDFNNLLQGIAGAIELMERRISQGRAAEAARYVAAARDGVSRAATLTHQLLAFSRRQALAPKRVDLDALIGGIGGLIQQTAGPGIKVARRLLHAGWCVRCDPNQLENAILNLAINARDAMLPHGEGGTLTVATARRSLEAAEVAGWDGAAPGHYVRVTVTDTGTGMSPDVLEHAFEPFFTTKPAGQGTGLGLSQVYGFARQSNGLLVLESAVGAGTSVHLYLPRDDEAAAAEAAPAAAGQAAVAGARVLLVEDEAEIRVFAAEMLRELGHVVTEAGDGAAGLLALRECHGTIDLLIADVGLPGGLNGRQLADAARELRPGLPVLVITGYAGGALEPKLPAGMGLLTKPFSGEQLAAAVAVALGG